MKKFIISVLAISAILALLVLGYNFLLEDYFFPEAPEVDTLEPESAADAKRQDLEYFQAHYLTLNRPYSFAALEEVSNQISALKENLDKMSDAQFELEIARLVALAQNGHSRVFSYLRALRTKRLPIRTYWFDDGLYIIYTHESLTHLLGARITHFGTMPVDNIFSALRNTSGGTDEYYRAYVATYLAETPALLHAAGLTSSNSEVKITMRLPSGETLVETLEPLSLNDAITPGFAFYRLFPQMPPTPENPWATYFEAGEAAPFYVGEGIGQEGLQLFRHMPLPEINGYYIQYLANASQDDETIRNFQNDYLEAIQTLSPQAIILDQRFNSGGDYTETAEAMRKLGQAVPENGTLYILTGNPTFSAGIISAAFAKEASRGNVVIVGQRIGDSEVAWSEGGFLDLPNSEITIQYSTGKYNVRDGCYNPIDCFWPGIIFYNVAAGSLDPNIKVPFTFSTYAQGRDAALDAVYELESGDSN